MGYDGSNVIQRDFGFPRITNSTDAEIEALYAMLVSLGATKMMALKLMEQFPEHRRAIDFAADGEGDIRGAIAKLEHLPQRRWRGGAT